MHQPIATWNPARGVWETPRTNLICGHSEPYSATWPSSGSMRNGSAYPRPTSAPPMSAGASSSSPGLPTPRARDWKTGGKDGLDEALKLLPTPTTSEGTGPGHATRGGMNLRTTISLLPTPRASDTGTPGRRCSEGFRPPLSQIVLPLLPTPTVADSRGTRNFRKDGTPYNAGYGETLTDAVTLLPTPSATPYGNNQSPSAGAAVRPWLNSLAPQLLPTPRASDGEKGGPNQRGSSGDLTLPSVAYRIGESTKAPSGTGRPSSDAPFPGQLTIGDDSPPSSPSG